MYNPEITKLMEKELTDLGITPLKTAEEVQSELEKPGTSMVIVNSVCGCASGTLRPGVQLALENSNLPERKLTVFAGVDLEATEKARSFFHDRMPSSPSIALMKNGKIEKFLERKDIMGLAPEKLSENLKEAFNEFC